MPDGRSAACAPRRITARLRRHATSACRTFPVPAACAGLAVLATAAGGDVTAAPAIGGANGHAVQRSSSVLAAGHLPARDQQARASRARERLVLRADQRVAAEARRRAAAPRRAAARQAARPRYVLPVTGYRLTAGFGAGGGLWSSSHTGQDFAAPTGVPVRAVSDGVVTSAGWDGAYGRKIEITHRDGTVTWYCHLSAVAVRRGKVTAGQVIGRVGSTGNTTGPHLHLEVRIGGDPVNPLAWLRRRGLEP